MSSNSIEKHPHVLIVGAGIGGLVLAQALRKQNVSFQIFERDASPDARAQGWAISLHWILNDLLASIPADMPDIMETSNLSNLGLDSEGYQYDGTSGEVLFHLGGQGTKLLRAHRGKLRRWLSTHLEIQWARNLSRFEETESGVTVYFEDGSSASGDVLVGADGAHSHVRAALFPGNTHTLQTIPLALIGASPTLSKPAYTRQLAIGHSFYVPYSPSSLFFVGFAGASADLETGNHYWMFMWKDPTMAAEEPHWTTMASKEDLYAYVTEHSKEYLPKFTEIVRETKVADMWSPPMVFRDIVPKAVKPGKVTLLGDAAHAMAPFRGEGGSHAMRDGLNLALILAREEGNMEDKLKEYEAEMIPRASDAVLKSRAATQEENGGHLARAGWRNANSGKNEE